MALGPKWSLEDQRRSSRKGGMKTKELRMRGWQCPCVWVLVVGLGQESRTYTYPTLKEAEEEGKRLLSDGPWEYATIYLKEKLYARKE